MSEPESAPPDASAETPPSRGAGLRLLASVIALAAVTTALLVAIVLVTSVLSSPARADRRRFRARECSGSAGPGAGCRALSRRSRRVYSAPARL